jgi:hypothetical protein
MRLLLTPSRARREGLSRISRTVFPEVKLVSLRQPGTRGKRRKGDGEEAYEKKSSSNNILFTSNAKW